MGFLLSFIRVLNETFFRGLLGSYYDISFFVCAFPWSSVISYCCCSCCIGLAVPTLVHTFLFLVGGRISLASTYAAYDGYIRIALYSMEMWTKNTIRSMYCIYQLHRPNSQQNILPACNWLHQCHGGCHIPLARLY